MTLIRAPQAFRLLEIQCRNIPANSSLASSSTERTPFSERALQLFDWGHLFDARNDGVRVGVFKSLSRKPMEKFVFRACTCVLARTLNLISTWTRWWRNGCAQIKITNQNWSWQSLMKTLRKMMRLTRKAKLSSQTFAFEIDLWTEVVHKDQTQAFCRHLKNEVAPSFRAWALITQLNELVWLRSFVCHICCPWKVLHGS